MTLIKSISGIRGTIGGFPGDNLTPIDIVKFSAAFAEFIKESQRKEKIKLVIGRDARVSGPMVNYLIIGSMMAKGVDIIDIGLATTPTVEIYVPELNADGGIIITASHNPGQWNALKLLNGKGEFINAVEGARVLELAENPQISFSDVSDLGKYECDDKALDIHIKQILDLPLVDKEAIAKANFKVAIDCVNSVGGISIVPLLKILGVKNILELYTEPSGDFPHNPEPLPENLTEISELIKRKNADIGFVVDPDVDRLAIVLEDGNMFGEEYTLVAVSDYILQNKKGNTVSNLSSTRALRDVTQMHGGEYAAAAVGEVNVVLKMKETNAIIGGEGNGGIIYPELHYGRDALVGIALFLTFLAKSGKKCSELRSTYPEYHISKNKITLSPEMDVDNILLKIKELYKEYGPNTIDGVKIDFENGWVHLRKSNTEPIIRIYAEGRTKNEAADYAEKLLKDINSII